MNANETNQTNKQTNVERKKKHDCDVWANVKC